MDRTRLFVTISVSVALLAVASAPPAQADEMYLWVRGQKQGQIKGGVIRKGLEGFIDVIRMNYEVVNLRDDAGGLPTGKRQHKPFTITKPIDKSTPLFFRALVDNETLPEVILDTWMPQIGSGAMMKFQTIKLINARVAGYRRFTEPDPRAVVRTLEELAFVFQDIEIVHHDGGLIAGDSWTPAQ